MAGWNYTKDCMPNDGELKWVAMHDNRYNSNYLKKAYFSQATHIWYDEYDDELPNAKNVYAWRDYEKPLIPVYRG